MQQTNNLPSSTELHKAKVALKDTLDTAHRTVGKLSKLSGPLYWVRIAEATKSYGYLAICAAVVAASLILRLLSGKQPKVRTLDLRRRNKCMKQQ